VLKLLASWAMTRAGLVQEFVHGLHVAHIASRQPDHRTAEKSVQHMDFWVLTAALEPIASAFAQFTTIGRAVCLHICGVDRCRLAYFLFFMDERGATRPDL
jgi:hypothetical protein